MKSLSVEGRSKNLKIKIGHLIKYIITKDQSAIDVKTLLIRTSSVPLSRLTKPQCITLEKIVKNLALFYILIRIFVLLQYSIIDAKHLENYTGKTFPKKISQYDL